MKFEQYLEKIQDNRDDMPGPMQKWINDEAVSEYQRKSALKSVKWIKENGLKIKGWFAGNNPNKEMILNIELNNGLRISIFGIDGTIKINNKKINSLKDFKKQLK